MRKYAILGSLLILGMALAGRAVSLAQKPPLLLAIADPSQATKGDLSHPDQLANVPIVDQPIANRPVEPVSSEPMTLAGATEPPFHSNPSDPPATAGSVIEPAAVQPIPPTSIPTQITETASIAQPPGEDPMGAVDHFVDRNLKEAERSIETLNQEAEVLRARLQKVEAALNRWQEVSKALKAEGSASSSQPAAPQLEPIPNVSAGSAANSPALSPKTKPKWIKPEPETGATRPVAPEPLSNEPQPSPIPPASPPEVRPDPVNLPSTELPPTTPQPSPTPELPTTLPPSPKAPMEEPIVLPPSLPAPGEPKTPPKAPDAVPETLPTLPEPAGTSLPPILPSEPKLPEVPKSAPTA